MANERNGSAPKPAPLPDMRNGVGPLPVGDEREESRFTALRAAEIARGRIRKSFFRESFETLSIPSHDASFEQFNDYRVRANKAGVALTAQDLITYANLADDLSGTRVFLEMERDAKASPGLRALAKAFATQHPDVAQRAREQARFGRMNVADHREDHEPERLADMHPERVTHPKRFAANMARVNGLPALPTEPSADQFQQHREAFRAVGLRLTQYELYLYRQLSRGVVADVGTGKMPPVVDALFELQKAPGERKLLNLDGAAFGSMLLERQPLPARRDERSGDRGEPSRAAMVSPVRQEPLYVTASESTTRGHAPQNADGRALNPYGRSPSPPSPARSGAVPTVTLVRGGSVHDVPMPPHFTSYGRPAYDAQSDTFTQTLGATTYKFDLKAVEKHAAPGSADVRALVSSGRDVTIRNSPQGIVVQERTRGHAPPERHRATEGRSPRER